MANHSERRFAQAKAKAESDRWIALFMWLQTQGLTVDEVKAAVTEYQTKEQGNGLEVSTEANST